VLSYTSLKDLFCKMKLAVNNPAIPLQLVPGYLFAPGNSIQKLDLMLKVKMDDSLWVTDWTSRFTSRCRFIWMSDNIGLILIFLPV